MGSVEARSIQWVEALIGNAVPGLRDYGPTRADVRALVELAAPVTLVQVGLMALSLIHI